LDAWLRSPTLDKLQGAPVIRIAEAAAGTNLPFIAHPPHSRHRRLPPPGPPPYKASSSPTLSSSDFTTSKSRSTSCID
jgi:hypothetical protein